MKRPFCIAALAGLLILSCSPDRPSEDEQVVQEGTPGDWPIARVVDVLEYGRLVFYPAPEVDWTELVNLEILEGFRPGMTGKEAEQALGPADEYREKNAEKFWIYERPGGRIVVAHEFKGSFIGGWWWRLDAHYDPPLPPSELLHSSIVRELPESLGGRYTVTIMNSRTENQTPAALVYIQRGKVIGIDITPSGARGATLGQSPDLG